MPLKNLLILGLFLSVCLSSPLPASPDQKEGVSNPPELKSSSEASLTLKESSKQPEGDLIGQETFYPVGGFWWGGYRPWYGHHWGGYRPWYGHHWGGYRPWHGYHWGGHRPWNGPQWGGHWVGASKN